MHDPLFCGLRLNTRVSFPYVRITAENFLQSFYLPPPPPPHNTVTSAFGALFFTILFTCIYLPSLFSSFFKLSLSHHSSVFLPNNFPILFKYLSFFHFSYIFLAILSLPFFHEIFFRGPISISLSFAFISMTFFPPFS